ncbi:MAG: FAD-dependent oxidoreductase, partial [Desulfobacterales bacterium]|nr:FAD-dependent oxidoreductase [Desulfobacterales bacterium]
CMYSIKEAVIAKEHSGGDLDCAVFYMDIRTHGKDFERYYDDAREKHGVRFINTRVPTIDKKHGTDDLVIKYTGQNGKFTEEIFDMVVLSIGLETPPELIEMAESLGVELTEGQFCKTGSFRPVATSQEGIYVCGAFAGPKDITQSVIEASSAAAEAGALLSKVRNTRTKEKETPEERNITG